MIAQLIQNSNTDTLNPSLEITKLTMVVIEILEENISFVAKNGLTEKAKQSRERLIKLIKSTELFNQIATQNSGLKLYNHQLFSENQKLKNEIKELERQYNIANAI